MLNICAITAIIVIIMIAIIIVISSDGVGSSTVTIASPICKESYFEAYSFRRLKIHCLNFSLQLVTLIIK